MGTNIHLMGASKGEERKGGRKMLKVIPRLMANINFTYLKTQFTPEKISRKRSIPRQTTVKIMISKDKKEILKAKREK